MAERTPRAPKSAPTSWPKPHACKHTAPSECSAGFPPEVNDERQESATKIGCDLFDTTATRASARPSTEREIPARYRSKLSSRPISYALGLVPGGLVGFGFR